MRETGTEKADLEIVGVSRHFGPVLAVDDVSLTVRHGEIVAILGPSGSGKSTLLGMIGGQLDPDSGDIRIGGRSVVSLPPNQRETATVFQDYALFPHLTVGENVAFGLRMHRWPKDKMVEQVEHMLALVDLSGYGQRRISQLSGGQRQRVATIRALAVEPKVLLLDEPLGALDRLIRQRLQREMTQLLRRLSVTAILVTHDQQEAFTMSDRVAVMHQGRLQQIGSPGELYASPLNSFVATFLGKGVLVDAKVVNARSDSIVVEAGGSQFGCRGQTADTRARVLIRPEHVSLVPPASQGAAVWKGMTVTEVVQAGETTEFVVKKNNFRLEALVLGPAKFQAGDPVDCLLESNGPVIVAG
jgi:ABC-type Fe3+/spermidine/putrescine transport system ATPase subunit